ncbi:MAG TPA: glycosyl hydrolase family 18 protein [Terriglobales bacterium]|nr:glycosyl hydrolase family 18 protein [Terriglobales bacterium]
MKKIVVVLLLVFCSYAALAATPSKSAPKKAKIETLMYLVNRADSIQSFREHAKQVSIIAPQCFSMDAEGFVGGEVPPEVLEIARTNGVALMPLVTNKGFNQPLMHTMLDNADSRARAIKYLIYLSLRDGYIGIQFDYENILYTYRDKFTVFVREAAKEFHKHGLKLSLAVVGKYSDDRNSESPGGYDNWSGVYDYTDLGKVADFLSIMAYPQHAGFSDPGPLAGVPWVKQVAEFSLSKVPARKLSLGVPTYGIRWTAVSADQNVKPADFVQDNAGAQKKKWTVKSMWFTGLKDVVAQSTPIWDETEQANRYELTTADGANSVIWYEDARSLQPKLTLAVESGMPGISAWVIGMEDPDFWTMLDREFRVTHPKSPAVKGTQEERAKRAARLLEGK